MFTTSGKPFKRSRINHQACIQYWCKVGVYSEVIQHYKEDIDLRMNNDELIRNVCKVGHLDLVKWLLKKTNNKINIHMDNDILFHYAYQCAVETNRYQLVKWLIDFCDIIPSFDHPMFYYYLKSLNRKGKSSLILLNFFINIQRKVKHWLYYPKGKLAKEHINHGQIMYNRIYC